MTGSPFLLRHAAPGTISSAKMPFSCAATQRAWLRAAKASWSARLTWNSAATLSAVSGIESMPKASFIFGLTKRQPMVVS